MCSCVCVSLHMHSTVQKYTRDGYSLPCVPVHMQALVLRECCPELGPTHVDTALVAHNLGCVLGALGKSHKGLELVGDAQKVSRSC